jgi:hypothetical protein
MLRVWHRNKWKTARSEPKPIKRGKSKGKFWILIYTGNRDHPEGLKRIKVTQDDLREIQTKEPELLEILPSPDGDTPKSIKKLQAGAQNAVKFGNGIQQRDLFKKAEQRSLF